MLAEALGRGERVLVSNGIVFLYAGWRSLAGQGEIVDARVRRRDDLEGRDDPLHRSRAPQIPKLLDELT